MATAKDTTNDKPAEQNPQKGGSYVRQADGSLELQQATKPAAPVLNTHPVDPATARQE